jgi:hypothetical protein
MHPQHLDAARWMISIVLLLGAGIIGSLAIPLWRGKVAPNDTYGVRTPQTLADPALWYRANAIVGRNMAMFSAAFACLTVLFHFTLARDHFVLSVSLLGAVLLAGTVAIAMHGMRIR